MNEELKLVVSKRDVKRAAKAVNKYAKTTKKFRKTLARKYKNDEIVEEPKEELKDYIDITHIVEACKKTIEELKLDN